MTKPVIPRLPILDGWRACSIILVLAGHLFPLSPKSIGLNGAVAASGMVLFFILSGFLITMFLSETQDLKAFILRRVTRIVPVAWIGMLVALWMSDAGWQTYLANFLFYANLPPISLVDAGAHLWSLCVEMQFYMGIAIFVALFSKRGLYVLPLLCLAVTAHRISEGAYIDIVTWRRVDEILAGAMLALAYRGWFGNWPKTLLSKLNVYYLLPIIVASAHPAFGPLNYFRPYIAMLAVGASIYNPPYLLQRVFESRPAYYIATVSYAVYVIHAILTHTWLGSGDIVVKYLKRPLLLAITFGLAHLSTFYLERPINRFAKKVTTRRAKCSENYTQ